MSYIIETRTGSLLSTQPFANGNMISATAQFTYLTKPLVSKFYNGLKECELVPGVFSRYPDLPTNTSIDDYLSAACHAWIARNIYDRGKHTWGFFDLFEGHKLSQWLWRFPGFWSHVKLAAGIPLTLLGKIAWAEALILAAREPMSNQDGWMQSHLMVLVYEAQTMTNSNLCNWAIKYWRSKKSQPTSEIVAAYIGDPEHPLVKAWEGKG